MEIRPENLAIDLLGDAEHMVMIVPVDAKKDKAQDVAQEDR
jgi:hypothetical protein